MDCMCQDAGDDEPDNSNTSFEALLAVFVVLLIAFATVVGILLFVCFRNVKHFHLDKLHVEETSNGEGHFSAASDGTHMYDDPCATPASTLQRSRKSSFSR